MLKVCPTYELPKNRMVSKCPVCGLSKMTQKKVKSHLRFHGNTSLYRWNGAEGVKTRCFCYLHSSGRIFNSTNLLNNVRRQWWIQDFCEGDAAGVWPPIFSERMTPTFYDRSLTRIGVARIFRG